MIFPKCISVMWFPLPALWLKEGHLGFSAAVFSSQTMHHKLPWLLYCAKALHVHLGSQFWLGFPYLTLIPLSIWIKYVRNARQSVFIISVLYEGFANTKKRASEILLLSCNTWIGGSIFCRCVQFHICNDCTVWSVKGGSWTWCLHDCFLRTLALELSCPVGCQCQRVPADGHGHVGFRKRWLGVGI